MTTVNCPSCAKPVEWSETSEFRPFCSKKCQLIDLGDWATEAHSIPAAPSGNMADHIDEEAIAEQFEQQQKSFFNND
ncbi:DNA gyrase inhibitor YacG [Alteromonas oceanisediminis]|uniref:DNA gyrase inhibitor YacG n=1 Tax=Alteromonas oceanisediminis TaxID=2836180 RepID=UPI001BDAB5E2|nr:DNA gyrase inhibitor YacG [Alteromonas oceanisediminis]MBT0585537.1 DNA gyrase inhibitor YacG [Alteromonas oceanisediminis]